MEKMIAKYIELICKKGINIQKGQPVYITAAIENYDFTIKLVEELYKLEAKEVYVEWISDDIARMNLKYKTEEELANVPEWIVKREEYYNNTSAAFIRISSRDPEALKTVDPTKLAIQNKALLEALEPFKKRTMNDENTWCVFSIPSLNWAKKVFPSSSNPIEDLWKAILKATKCDQENPIEEWTKHLEKLSKLRTQMTELSFEKLHFTNDLGTDLYVGLVQDHIWEAGQSINKNLKNEFVPNIPTEEVFTMPHKYKVNGKVYATKALNYNGNLIEDFWIEFKDGKAINWDANKGKDILTNLINTDKGSCYLGEVALVEDTNPISKLDIIFYSTLFDENAACHLAFGDSYPTTKKDGDLLTSEQKEEQGMNESIVHVDFMFGDSTMNVVGIKGTEQTQIFKNGIFTLE